jgi:hypothetical protein
MSELFELAADAVWFVVAMGLAVWCTFALCGVGA